MRYRITTFRYDGEWVAEVAQFPSLSWIAKTRIGAMVGLYKMIREIECDL